MKKKENNWSRVVLDGAVALLVLSLLFLLIILILQRFNAQDNVMETNVLLTLITFTMTLSVVIPYIVGRTIEAAEIRKIVQEKMDCMVSEIANEYRTNMSALSIDSGHSARMSAEMIRGNDMSQEYKYIWSIGWASKALIRYHNADYDNDRIIESCTSIIDECVASLNKMEADNESAGIDNKVNDDDRDLFLRTVTDCFDAYILLGEGKVYASFANKVYADFAEYMNKYIKNKQFDCGGQKSQQQKRYDKEHKKDYVEEYVKNHSKYLLYKRESQDFDFEQKWNKFFHLK